MRKKQPGLGKFKYATSATSSELGLYYILGLAVVFGGFYKILFLYVFLTEGCDPEWDLWLSRASGDASLLGLINLSYMCFGVLVSLDVISYLRFSRTWSWPVLVGYAGVLGWTAWMLAMMFIFEGAMVPFGPRHEAFDFAVEVGGWDVDGRYYAYVDPPDGPFGTCDSELLRRQLWWEERQRLYDEENFVKKSYFEERDWSTWDPKKE